MPGVLLAAVSDGVALMTWRQDGFAYADAVDESLGTFRRATGRGRMLN